MTKLIGLIQLKILNFYNLIDMMNKESIFRNIRLR